MTSLILADALQQLQNKCPCRAIQLYQLATYYNNHFPSPPILVAHGLSHTGKLTTILSVLEATRTTHTLIRSRECLSQRHLLTKIFSGCIRSLNQADQNEIENYDRVDSINALLSNLQKLFKSRTDEKEKFVLVIDGIDKQRGTTYALLPALARLGDEIPALSVILISDSPRLLTLHRVGVPYVYFAPYTRKEAIQIVGTSTPLSTPLQPESLPDEFPTVSNTTLVGIYNSFVAAVYDTLTVHTSSTSLPTFRRTCEKLWPRFIWPMLVGEEISGKRGDQYGRKTSSTVTWDFARLLVRNRSLFQADGEKALLDNLTMDSKQAWTFDELLKEYTANVLTTGNPGIQSSLTTSLKQSKISSQDPSAQEQPQPTLLKFFPTLLLLSSYLASHTQPKHDIILFSRLSSSSSHKRRYLSSTLNRSKIRRTPTKPKSSSTATEDDLNGGSSINDTSPSKKRSKAVNAELDDGTRSNGGGGAVSTGYEKEKTHRSSRLLFEKTSSIPKPFALERVIAILRAVHPDGVARGLGKGVADKVYVEMAELERLRLVVRAGGGGGGAGDGGGGGGRNDDGVLEEKWRVNVGREVVVDMGRRWGVGVDGWEID